MKTVPEGIILPIPLTPYATSYTSRSIGDQVENELRACRCGEVCISYAAVSGGKRRIFPSVANR